MGIAQLGGDIEVEIGVVLNLLVSQLDQVATACQIPVRESRIVRQSVISDKWRILQRSAEVLIMFLRGKTIFNDQTTKVKNPNAQQKRSYYYYYQ